MNDFNESKDLIVESAQYSRYSIEVNYRSELSEVLDAFAKITLGYVSAGLKLYNYHCKTVFSKKPFRVFAGTRNWDDGEWIAVIMYDHHNKSFLLGEGYYDRGEKVVRIKNKNKIVHTCASEIVKAARELLETLKKRNPEKSSSLNAIPMKRGPRIRTIKKSR